MVVKVFARVRARGGRVVFVVVMIPVIMVVFRVSGFFWGDLTMVDGGFLLVWV